MKVCAILVIRKKIISSQIFFLSLLKFFAQLFSSFFLYYHKSVFHARTRKSFLAKWFAQPLIKYGMTILIFFSYLKKIIEIKMYGLQLFPGA